MTAARGTGQLSVGSCPLDNSVCLTLHGDNTTWVSPCTGLGGTYARDTLLLLSLSIPPRGTILQVVGPGRFLFIHLQADDLQMPLDVSAPPLGHQIRLKHILQSWDD